MKRRKLLTAAAGGIGATTFLSRPATAAPTNVKIGIEPGLTYLPFFVMKYNQTLEKHAALNGAGPITADYWLVNSGDVMDSGLIAGDVAFVASGLPNFLLMWAKTQNNLKVKGVCGFDTVPLKLVTRDPNVHSVKDFTDKDRIAVPVVKASTAAIILQMAAEQAFGEGQWARLDKLTVSRGHPDAMAELLSPEGEITAHFSAPPFQDIELQHPGIHLVLTAAEVVGGPFTVGQLYTSTAYHDANPKICKAMVDALAETSKSIESDPVTAAKAYLAVTKVKQSVDDIVKLLADPDFRYTVVPQRSEQIATFMHHIGTIKTKPDSWKDLYFPEVHDLAGS